MKIPRSVQLILGILIAGVGLYIFFRDVDIGILSEHIRKVSPVTIIISGLLSILTLWFRSIRWKIMLPDIKGTEKVNLFNITIISFMINNVIPARMGEAVRAVLLWKKNKFPVTTAVGSVLTERILDTIVYLSFFFVPVFLLDKLQISFDLPIVLPFLTTLTRIAAIAAFFTGLVILFFIVYAIFPAWTRSIGKLSLMLAPEKLRSKIRTILIELVSNLDWLFNFKKVIAIIILSLLTCLCYSSMLLILAWKLSPMSFLESIFSESFATFGSAIPLAPGYIGTLHATLAYGMSLCGIDKNSATAITLLFHSSAYIFVTLTGIFYFFRLNVSYKDIQSAKDTLNAAEENASS